MTASTTPSSSSTGNCWSLLLFLTSCFASVFLSRFKILSWWFVFTGDATKIDFQSLLSLADEGIDVSFLKPRGKKRLNTHISYYKCHLSRAATIHFLRNRYISQYKSHETIHDTIHHNIQPTSDVMLLNCFGILNFH